MVAGLTTVVKVLGQWEAVNIYKMMINYLKKHYFIANFIH